MFEVVVEEGGEGGVGVCLEERSRRSSSEEAEEPIVKLSAVVFSWSGGGGICWLGLF